MLTKPIDQKSIIGPAYDVDHAGDLAEELATELRETFRVLRSKQGIKLLFSV